MEIWYGIVVCSCCDGYCLFFKQKTAYEMRIGDWSSDGCSSDLSADVAAGEKVFAKCAACHTVNQGGANGIGPNLYGTVGEPIGQGKGGFAFSDALKSKGGNWTFENLDHWLTRPREFAPGTKMTLAGLGKERQRGV